MQTSHEITDPKNLKDPIQTWPGFSQIPLENHEWKGSQGVLFISGQGQARKRHQFGFYVHLVTFNRWSITLSI